jgi:hypothetical protein
MAKAPRLFQRLDRRGTAARAGLLKMPLDVTSSATIFRGSPSQGSSGRWRPDVSRMDQIENGTVVEDIGEDADIALWNRMGRAAMFFCIWSAMAIPPLLVIAVR